MSPVTDKIKKLQYIIIIELCTRPFRSYCSRQSECDDDALRAGHPYDAHGTAECFVTDV